MSTAHHDDAETPALSAITIFTGSALGDDPAFAREARRLAEHLAREELEVVYGGGNVGLMGVVADAARSAGAGCAGSSRKAWCAGRSPTRGWMPWRWSRICTGASSG